MREENRLSASSLLGEHRVEHEQHGQQEVSAPHEHPCPGWVNVVVPGVVFAVVPSVFVVLLLAEGLGVRRRPENGWKGGLAAVEVGVEVGAGVEPPPP